jgi:NAD-dependent deacetylase
LVAQGLDRDPASFGRTIAGEPQPWKHGAMQGSHHLLILTGAGISADSGVRTFRDAGGLWEGHRVEDVATPEGWARDPALVWRFYQERRRQLREVVPNAAHLALAASAMRLAAAGHRMTLVTQNVDDLHQRAGSAALAMHGELLRLRCERCGSVFVDRDHLDLGAFVPCAGCGHARLRPHIVWFGEVPFHLDAIAEALASCTHFAAIGTSGQVWPAAGMLAEARSRGAVTWVQALDAPGNLQAMDRWRPGRAAEAVPALLRELGDALGMALVD